jgi:predicted transcriptional regulator
MATITIRIPDELREQVAALAAAERRSVNMMITLLIEQALAAR